jgi:hypothetical protein
MLIFQCIYPSHVNSDIYNYRYLKSSNVGFIENSGEYILSRQAHSRMPALAEGVIIGN